MLYRDRLLLDFACLLIDRPFFVHVNSFLFDAPNCSAKQRLDFCVVGLAERGTFLFLAFVLDKHSILPASYW
jgi:hypothetical protein